jgi:hypothetical protein
VAEPTTTTSVQSPPPPTIIVQQQQQPPLETAGNVNQTILDVARVAFSVCMDKLFPTVDGAMLPRSISYCEEMTNTECMSLLSQVLPILVSSPDDGDIERAMQVLTMLAVLESNPSQYEVFSSRPSSTTTTTASATFPKTKPSSSYHQYVRNTHTHTYINNNT